MEEMLDLATKVAGPARSLTWIRNGPPALDRANIRAAIDGLSTNKRIGVLVSGHLSLEIGGPKQFERHLTDPNFDAAAVGFDVRY